MRWDCVGLILLVVVRAKRAVETGQFSHLPVAVQCSFGAAFGAFGVCVLTAQRRVCREQPAGSAGL